MALESLPRVTVLFALEKLQDRGSESHTASRGTCHVRSPPLPTNGSRIVVWLSRMLITFWMPWRFSNELNGRSRTATLTDSCPPDLASLPSPKPAPLPVASCLGAGSALLGLRARPAAVVDGRRLVARFPDIVSTAGQHVHVAAPSSTLPAFTQCTYETVAERRARP